MNGTVFGGTVDPRMSRMLSPAPDGVYRGLDINVNGFGALHHGAAAEQLHGYAAPAASAPGPLPVRRQGQGAGDDVRAAPVHQG
jgi:hypothetical protein